MKLGNYVFLMVVGIVAMALAPLEPCEAEWSYITSSVASGPWYGYKYDAGFDWQYEWEFEVSNIDTSADAGGAEAAADCEASCSAEVSPSGASVYKDPSASCTSWSSSYYYQSSGSDVLVYEWEISASGTVAVSGNVSTGSLDTGDTADSDADAYSGVDSSGDFGDGGASGWVSESTSGVAAWSLYGEATQDSSSLSAGTDYYSASLSFSVEVSDDDDTDGSSFSADADVYASVSCYAGVEASSGYSGSALAGASADCGGSVSVSVSYP